MKRLDEVLSKSKNSATSGDATATSPAPTEDLATCLQCGGAGFVRRRRPLDDPGFGKAEPCSCVLQEAEDVRRARLQRIGNLSALGRYTFAALDPSYEGASSAQREAVEHSLAFAESPAGFLTLVGPSGSGKTHLAAAIGNRRIEYGEPACFMVVADLLDHLRAGYDNDDEDLRYASLFEQVRNAPLLILDDVDAAAGTPWAREKLYQLVNGRQRDGLPTVFTAAALDGLDDRLRTRLADPRNAQLLRIEKRESAPYRQVGGMTATQLARLQFRNFDARGSGLGIEEQASLEAAYRSAMAYAEDPQGWLILQGANGCGKTHLAAAIANRALRDGRGVFFAVVPDFLDYLRRTYAPGRDGQFDDLFDAVREAELLVLDDLGAQNTSPWAHEKLYQVVNYRTVGGLPTVVTTDRALDELQSAHPRIFARVADPAVGTVSVILAPHYRLGR
jgi:DNA replication protein DnaC